MTDHEAVQIVEAWLDHGVTDDPPEQAIAVLVRGMRQVLAQGMTGPPA